MLSQARKDEIARIADDLIVRSKQERKIPINLNKIIDAENLAVSVFEVAKNPKFKEYSGIIDKKNKKIYVNGDEPAYRKRFTIAHEIGHLLLNHSKSVDFRNTTYSGDMEEVEADFFAASLLMPKDTFIDLYHRLNLSSLAAFFGVSRKAIGIRADEVFNYV